MPLTRTLVWQGVDAPRMEIAHVRVDGRQLIAEGTQIGAGYELRYVYDVDRLDTEIVGTSTRQTFLLGDADFFDLGYSPLFNTLPVLRDGLLNSGAGARDYVMQWVSVPDLTVERSEQRYEPFGDRRIRFSAGTFTAILDVDDDGFVTSYEGLATLVS